MYVSAWASCLLCGALEHPDQITQSSILSASLTPLRADSHPRAVRSWVLCSPSSQVFYTIGTVLFLLESLLSLYVLGVS